jgi:hypothetical protein
MRQYSAGGVLWNSQFGTPGQDWAHAIAANGPAVYVVGCAWDALSGQASPGAGDVFLCKYDDRGNVLWTRQFGTPAYDVAWGVVADTSSVYLAGCTGGALSGQNQAGGRDAFVCKYDDNGNEVWTRQFGSPRSTQVFGAAVDGAGNIFVAGVTSDALPGQKQVGANDGFVREYSPAGVELWTRQFSSSSSSVTQPGPISSAGGQETIVTILPSVKPSGVGVDGRGQVIVVGDSNGDMLGQTNAGDWDAFVIAWAPRHP